MKVEIDVNQSFETATNYFRRYGRMSFGKEHFFKLPFLYYFLIEKFFYSVNGTLFF